MGGGGVQQGYFPVRGVGGGGQSLQFGRTFCPSSTRFARLLCNL